MIEKQQEKHQVGLREGVWEISLAPKQENSCAWWILPNVRVRLRFIRVSYCSYYLTVISSVCIHWQEKCSVRLFAQVVGPSSLLSPRLSAPLCTASLPVTVLLLVYCTRAARLVTFLSVHNTVPLWLLHVAVISWDYGNNIFLFVTKAGERNSFKYSAGSPLSHYQILFFLFSTMSNTTRLLIFLNAEAYLITGNQTARIKLQGSFGRATIII